AILFGSLARKKAAWTKPLRAAKITRGDLLVGIDGGVQALLSFGLKPDLAIGDWDSFSKSRFKDPVLLTVPRVDLPTQKDRSDLFYALAAVTAQKIDEVVCLGVTGGRPDHHLAALSDLAHF